MTEPVLVTGGTGTLGRAVVARLREDGRDHRVLSRSAGDVTGDLLTGRGIDDAVQGASTILHLATGPRRDADATRTLVEAARRHGSPHLVYVSIVGIDRIPLAYYREKLAVETVLAGSGVPWTILRATQFHDLLGGLFGVLARTGLLPVLAGTSFQPVDVRDVAARLVELAASAPAGRVPDLGGPQVLGMDELARTWLRATGRRRPVVPIRMPGALARAFRTGANTCPDHADGTVTFEAFLADRPERARR